METLTNQLVEGLRKAIEDGVLAEGDRLPTWKQLAAELKVSTRIPREAMRRLSEAGYVVARPRLGCRVLKPSGRKKSWKGMVLLVTSEQDDLSYAHIAFARELRIGLSRAGYQLLVAPLREIRRGVYDFETVTAAMRFQLSLAVVANNKAKVCRRFSEYGVPFFVTGDKAEFPHCCGALSTGDASAAVKDLAGHCRRAGVRRVLQVGFCSPSAFDVVGELAAAGLETERWTIPPKRQGSRMESIRATACAAFKARFGGVDPDLPDLIVFTDDYIAAGGLLALTVLGIRVPRDVRVVTLANAGNVPLAEVALACVLNRPAVAGREAARQMISFLAGHPSPKPSRRIWQFLPGESFP